MYIQILSKKNDICKKTIDFTRKNYHILNKLHIENENKRTYNKYMSNKTDAQINGRRGSNILDIQSNLITYVNSYLDETGIKKKKLIEKSGIDGQRFSRILSNRARMRTDELEKICNALEISPVRFIPPKKKNE